MIKMSSLKEKLKSIKPLYIAVRKTKDCFKYFYSVYIDELKFYIIFIFTKIGIIPVDKKIESLKNSHEGEKILVVSTGPSLTVDDLELIKKSGITTISVNGIFKIFDKTDWRPDYYLVDDYWLLYIYKRDFKNMDLDSLAKKYTIFTRQGKRFVPEHKKLKNTSFINMNYFDHWETHYSKRKYRFSNDFRYGIYDFYTVTNSAITLANYMGASEIDIIGVDCNYSKAFNHIGEGDGVVIKEGKDFENCQISGYTNLKRLIGDNTCIYNVTRGGMLEVFPRKALEDILK